MGGSVPPLCRPRTLRRPSWPTRRPPCRRRWPAWRSSCVCRARTWPPCARWLTRGATSSGRSCRLAREGVRQECRLGWRAAGFMGKRRAGRAAAVRQQCGEPLQRWLWGATCCMGAGTICCRHAVGHLLHASQAHLAGTPPPVTLPGRHACCPAAQGLGPGARSGGAGGAGGTAG